MVKIILCTNKTNFVVFILRFKIKRLIFFMLYIQHIAIYFIFNILDTNNNDIDILLVLQFFFIFVP